MTDISLSSDLDSESDLEWVNRKPPSLLSSSSSLSLSELQQNSLGLVRVVPISTSNNKNLDSSTKTTDPMKKRKMIRNNDSAGEEPRTKLIANTATTKNIKFKSPPIYYQIKTFESKPSSLESFVSVGLDHVYTNFPYAHLTSKRIFYQHLKVLTDDLEKDKKEFEKITNSSKKIINITENSIQNLLTLQNQMNKEQAKIIEFLKSLPFDDFLIVLAKLKFEYDLYDGNLSRGLENMLQILYNKIIADHKIQKPKFIYNGESIGPSQEFIMNTTYSVFMIMFYAINNISLKVRASYKSGSVSLTTISEFFKAFDKIMKKQ